MMRYYATRIPAALITFVLGVAATNLGAYVLGSSDERDVLAVEREYVRAHVERDVAALDRALADDFSMFGGRVKKSHRLALISNPLFAVTSLKTEGVEVVVNGREAVVTGAAKLKGSFRGREFNTPRYGYTRHLEKRGGRWQIVSVEFTVPW
ncbi:MAG TPA: nuclear transport factor 2 family protein [Pyrinomonadaceae bacterium]|nr:nuclear transport factor 2 family protein [Pyrinomonadaceae bacterium]